LFWLFFVENRAVGLFFLCLFGLYGWLVGVWVARKVEENKNNFTDLLLTFGIF